MFFEENMNLKIFHYLRRCGVIPVQSFGNHIHPPAIRIRVTENIQIILFSVLYIAKWLDVNQKMLLE
jgi:hypothetical protein